MKISNFFLPFDIFCRHKTVAKLIGNQEGEILDVGGGVKGLDRFVKNKVVVSNLKEGDILADGRALPFADNSFSLVTSIDVLEHIPSWDREKFVNELKRVAKKRVILSFPLGTKTHIRAEKELKDFLEKKGEEVGYLEEHIANGLPTLKELEKILKNHSFQIFFGENFRLNNFLFKVQFTLDEKRVLRRFYFYFQKLINFLLNVFYYPFSLSSKPRRFTNRAYVVINK